MCSQESCGHAGDTWAGLERDAVHDALVPEADSFRTEGGRPGTTLFVDINYHSHVVGKQLNVM